MGFDQNDPRPIIQPKKATTKVNFAIGAGVVVFFIICVVAIAWMRMTHAG